MNRYTAVEIVRKTLAADYACQPSDWLNDAVIVVEAREMAGRRTYPVRPKEFVITTMGRGAVICCSADRLAWAREELGQRSKDELFSIPTFALINAYVAQDNQKLSGPALRYLCADETFCAAPVPEGITLELFERDRMVEAYQFPDFHHAVNYRLDYHCPDMVAVAAWHEGRVIGMAGASADSEELWQVGVNVLPEYQGTGVGKAVVSRVTEATLDHGKTPFYATLVANLASSNTALSVGYWLAWTDVYVKDL